MTLQPRFLFALIVAGTLTGLAGTDLVLPAIPALSSALPGTVAQAQLVLAGFAAGTWLSALGCLAILGYALTAGNNPKVLWGLFALVNLGLGLRGPPGFYQAIVAAGHNDARGSALVVLFVLATVATGTAAIAPIIEQGLVVLSLAASTVCVAAVAVWHLFPNRA